MRPAINPYLGKTVALTLCPGWAAGQEVVLSGLFDVEDLELEDHSAGIRSSSFLICPTTDDDHPIMYAVDFNEFIEQVDPQSYGHNMAIERHHELMMEEECIRESFEVGQGAWRTYKPEDARHA